MIFPWISVGWESGDGADDGEKHAVLSQAKESPGSNFSVSPNF